MHGIYGMVYYCIVYIMVWCIVYTMVWHIYIYYYILLFMSPGIYYGMAYTMIWYILSYGIYYMYSILLPILTLFYFFFSPLVAIRNDVKYDAIPRADFPGLHDYQCSMTQSLSAVNCQFLAFDETEAKQRCNEDSQCKAFVMSDDKTWTGEFVLLFYCCTVFIV